MKVVKKLSENFNSRWNTPLGNYACAMPPVAAVMMTKIHDFRSTVKKDQAAGLLLLTKSRRLQEYYCKRHSCTRLVKMGDNILVGFNSAEQAVDCALSIERSARKMFGHQLCIGIHLGVVRYVDGDLFGGPVNIAQDILNAASPGEVLLSEAAAKSINSINYILKTNGTAGPMAVPVFKVKSKSSKEVKIWNYHHSDILADDQSDLKDAI